MDTREIDTAEWSRHTYEIKLNGLDTKMKRQQDNAVDKKIKVRWWRQ